MDFDIDCPLFLRLTGCDLGEYGLYVVTTTGVRAERTEAEIEAFADSAGGGDEAPVLLEFIRDARLDFPVSVTALLAWQNKNPDFPLPDWLAEIAAANSTAATHATLDEPAAREEKALAALKRKVKRLKARGAKPRQLYPIETEAKEVQNTLDAIDAARSLLSVKPSPNGKAPASAIARRQRSDAMAVEIDAALSKGKQSPTEIMKWLKQQMGQPGSCVTDNAGDGVLWKGADGSNRKLTMNLLRQRLSRRR